MTSSVMTATLMFLIRTEVKQQKRGGFKGNYDHLTLDIICFDRREEKKTNKKFG